MTPATDARASPLPGDAHPAPVRDGDEVIVDSAAGTRASPVPGDALPARVRDGDAVIAETGRMSAEGLLPVLLTPV